MQRKPYIIQWAGDVARATGWRQWSTRKRYKTQQARDAAMAQFAKQGRSWVEYRIVDET